MADGYGSGEIQLKPDGNEHTIVLKASLTLFGTVTDASTGKPLSGFRIVSGWPETNFLTGEIKGHWLPQSEYWLSFEGGTYRHLFSEPRPLENSCYLFKFEADGYAPFVTSPFNGDEGKVQLDATLQPLQ